MGGSQSEDWAFLQACFKSKTSIQLWTKLKRRSIMCVWHPVFFLLQRIDFTYLILICFIFIENKRFYFHFARLLFCLPASLWTASAVSRWKIAFLLKSPFSCIDICAFPTPHRSMKPLRPSTSWRPRESSCWVLPEILRALSTTGSSPSAETSRLVHLSPCEPWNLIGAFF